MTTMPQVSAAHVTKPADGALNRVRSPAAKGSSDHGGADADFGKHLAGVAAGDERAAKTALGAVGDRERPVARWRQRGEDEPLPDQAQAPAADLEALTANATIAGTASSGAVAPPPAEAALLASDLAAAAASAAAIPSEARPVAVGSAPRTSVVRSPTAPRLPGASPDASELPLAPGGPPVGELRADVRDASQDTPRRVQDVFVVGRETHLTPATPQATLLRQAASRDLAQRTGASAPVPGDGMRAGDAHAKLSVQPAAEPAEGGKDGGERPANSASGRSPAAADATQRARSQTTSDAFDAARPSQGMDRLGPDDQLSPPQPLALSRQVADQIVADLPPARETGSANPVASSTMGPAAQPVRVVTIQLHPAELGTLTVRISLKNDALELQVEASRRETARLVDADRDALSGLLRSAGYHVEAMTVRVVEPPGAMAAPGASPGSPDAAPQSQSGGSQADQRPSGGQADAGQDRDMHGTRRDIRGGEDGSRHRAGRGLYV